MSKTTFTIKRDKLQVEMKREFKAPRELVFKAVTDPKMIPKWWGPKTLATTVEKDDLKVGGFWRYIHKDPEGNLHAFNGVYKEIVPHKKIVRTFEYEPLAGHVLEESLILEDLNNPDAANGPRKTRLTMTAEYTNLDDLEGMIGTGMEFGATESWERLAKLVERQ